MPRKRQLPYIKKLAQRGKVSVWLVDGSWVRTNIEQEWDNYGHHYGYSFIPENEIWLDQQADDDEQQFFIKHCMVERRLLARGVDEETARQKSNEAELEARREAGDLKKLRPKGHLANPEDMHVRLLKKLVSGVSVWIVKGRYVRSVFDIEFTAGGHDHVYEFIPTNEVWIDDDITDAERPVVILHELHERNIMEKGMDYDHAHEEASKLELHYRHHPEELHAALAKEGWE
ncbi:MAG TPA: hypothetical protein VFD70_13275 [Anaerolineae bacterium]|nr:hypothetical protein [Anaerolineae bacterium]